MPTYGPAKVRDIARSVLPSTRAQTARSNKAELKRRTRRNNRQTLRDWRAEVNAYDFEGFTFDANDPKVPSTGWDGPMSYIVSARRDGDKLGALLRWAPAVTRHLDDPEDRYMFVKAMLPDNLIGRHALGHVRGLDGFDFRNEFSRYPRRNSAEARAHWAAGRAERVDEAKRLLVEVIASGQHKEWNRRNPSDRLAGLHDVERCAEALLQWPTPDRRINELRAMCGAPSTRARS